MAKVTLNLSLSELYRLLHVVEIRHVHTCKCDSDPTNRAKWAMHQVGAQLWLSNAQVGAGRAEKGFGNNEPDLDQTCGTCKDENDTASTRDLPVHSEANRE